MLYRSPVYEHIYQQLGIVVAAAGSGTNWFDAIGTRTASGTGLATSRPYLVFNTTDHPGIRVLNLLVSMTATAAQTGITFTYGLYPVANTGTTTIIPTFGTVITGSTVAFSAPGAASESRANSGDFALPATNLYMIGLNMSGNAAASSEVAFTAILRGR